MANLDLKFRSWRTTLEEAVQLMKQKNWVQAEKNFKQITQKLMRGQKNNDELRKLLTQALTGWGQCLLEQKRAIQALKIAKRAMKIAPGCDEAQFLHLNALMALGKWHEAMKQVKLLIQKCPDRWEVHLLAAKIHSQFSHWKDTIEHLSTAFQLAGNREEPFESAARILELKRETKKAIALIEMGVKKFSTSANLWFTLGQLQRNLGQVREAIKSFEQVLELGRDTTMLREAIAYLCVELGWIGKAYEHVTKGLDLDPDNPNLLDLLAFIYLQRGEIQQALQVLSRLTKLAPTDTIFRFKMATLYQQLGNYQKSIQCYRQVIAFAPDTELAESAKNALELLDQYQLEQVFTLSMEDPIFRTKVMRDPVSALFEKGFLLSESSVEIIGNTDFSKLPKRWGSSHGLVS